MKSAPKICFVESSSYAVLNPTVRRASTGGESVQHTLLARAFAERGWQVSMVSRDFGQEDGIIVGRIRVWKTNVRFAGLPFIRFFYPGLFRSWGALRRADADVYFQSCAGLMTGVVARFVASRKRKMIFRVAHDTDCVPGEQLVTLERDRRIYEYGLRRADMISAQSNTQAQALAKNYGLKSHVIDMAAEIPGDPEDSNRDIDVLWVNNFREFKRPELLLDIARSMPDTSFTMIGGAMKRAEKLYDYVRDEALKIENIEFVGGISYSEVNSYFARAKVFLNTSDSEGFPNSFLQAWVRRAPVVSYFDPDGLIEGKGLGISVPSQGDFVAALSNLLADDDERLQMGQRARQFVIDRYSPRAIAAEYERLIFEHFGISLADG